MATEENKLKAIETTVNSYGKAKSDEWKSYNEYSKLLAAEAARRDSGVEWLLGRSTTVTEATKDRKLGDPNPFDPKTDSNKYAAVEAWDKWQRSVKASVGGPEAISKALKGSAAEKLTQYYLKQIDEQAKAGNVPSVDTVTHRNAENNTETIKTWIARERQANKEAEKAAAVEKAAAEAAAAKQEGLDNLKETIKLVSKGTIINIEGTSKSHEPARVEIAKSLEGFINGIIADTSDDNKDRKAGLLKALGIKGGESLNLVNDGAITDHKVLGKALRWYQADSNMVADGKVSSGTLAILLYHNNVADADISALTQGVAQALPTNKYGKVGHLCGKLNPCDLQNYDADNEDNKRDPRYAEKVEASRLLGEISKTFAAAKAKIESQEVKDGYTDKEAAAMKALFVGGDGKDALIDPDNITNDGIKAFERAFGLKVDKGVIGPEVARAIQQINLRLATDQVIDPSEISAAVHAAGSRPKAKEAAPAK